MLDLVFRSGMSHKSDLRGAMNAGVPVGVVAGELTTAQKFLALPGFLRQGGKVFIDSGAYTAFLSGETMDWPKILGCYESVAAAIWGSSIRNLYVVAPDHVGNQAETLRLLASWADRVRGLIDGGCHVIVPIQSGAMPGQQMILEATRILGCSRFIAGIPSNRAAMSVQECRTLQHTAFHILGRVQADQEQLDRIVALRTGNPLSIISADANWLRSRLAKVRHLTQEIGTERSRCRCRGQQIPPAEAIDHPRVRAVTETIEMDTLWGECVRPEALGRKKAPAALNASRGLGVT